jgi:hypothetical protein
MLEMPVEEMLYTVRVTKGEGYGKKEIGKQ